MTKKQKIMAYRKAAELIRDRKAYFLRNAIILAGLEEDLWCEYMVYQMMIESDITIDLRETILLSCAELVRLEFKIE